MAIDVPVVLPSNTPDRISGSSASLRCVVTFDCPGRRRSRSGCKSAADSSIPGGTPSIITTLPGPWLSPAVVMRNIWPKLLPGMVLEIVADNQSARVLCRRAPLCALSWPPAACAAPEWVRLSRSNRTAAPPDPRIIGHNARPHFGLCEPHRSTSIPRNGFVLQNVTPWGSRRTSRVSRRIEDDIRCLNYDNYNFGKSPQIIVPRALAFRKNRLQLVRPGAPRAGGTHSLCPACDVLPTPEDFGCNIPRA